MSLTEQLRLDWDAVFANPLEWGEAATYTPIGGAGVALTLAAAELAEAGERTDGSYRGMRVWIPRALLAEPRYGDGIALRGASWSVVRVGILTPDELWPLDIEADNRLHLGRGRQ